MAIIVKVQDTKQLIKSLNEVLKRNPVLPWEVDEEGDYTMTRDKWQYLAWMRPTIEKEQQRIVFGIVQSRRFNMTPELYGVYHGLFVATLLTYLDEDIDNIEITPLLLSGYDVFAGGDMLV